MLQNYFVQLLFSTTLLLFLVSVAALLFRKSAASTRHRIWGFSVVGLLLLPALIVFVPKKPIGTVTIPVVEKAEVPAILPHVEEVAEDVSFDVAGVKPEEFFSEPESVVPESRGDDASPRPQIAARAWIFSWAAVAKFLPVAWGLGTVLFLSRFLLSLLAVRRLMKRLYLLEDATIRQTVTEIAKGLKVRRSVRLLRSEISSSVPFTTGIIVPTIVVPPEFTDWNESRQRSVLTHELGHVARRDVAWQILCKIVVAIYWFHPLAWLAAWRIRIERELACDDLVLMHGEKPSDYADVLLELADNLKGRDRRHVLGCTVAMARKNAVRQRIVSILNPATRRTPLGKIGSAIVLLLAVAGISVAAMLSPLEKSEHLHAGNTDNSTKTESPEIILKGIVVDEDDRPVRHAVVDVLLLSVEPVTTDENGRFQILYPGRPNLSSPFYARLPGTDFVAYRQFPELTEGANDLPEIKITLEKGRRFFGKVVDVSGKPVAGAYVGASQQLLTIEPVLSDEKGEFELYFPQTRTNDLFAIKPGVGFDFVGVETKNNTALPGPLEQEHGPILLTLTQDKPISFLITDERNNPLEGVRVSPWVICKKNGSNTNISVNMQSSLARKLGLFSSITDAKGRTVINWMPKDVGLKKEDLRGLNESALKIEFFADDLVEGRKGVFGRGKMYWEPGVKKLSAKLPKLVRIEGSVRLADGSPVPWAQLSYSIFSSGNGWGYADAAGNFSYNLNPHEKMSLAVESALGAAPTVYEIDAGDGRNPPRIDFILREAAKFYGTVLAGPDKQPYPTNLTLTEYTADKKHSVLRHVRVDKNGCFETCIPCAKYAVHTWLPHDADGRSRTSDTREFEITDKTEKRMDFHFGEAPLISLPQNSISTDETGKPDAVKSDPQSAEVSSSAAQTSSSVSETSFDSKLYPAKFAEAVAKVEKDVKEKKGMAVVGRVTYADGNPVHRGDYHTALRCGDMGGWGVAGFDGGWFHTYNVINPSMRAMIETHGIPDLYKKSQLGVYTATTKPATVDIPVALGKVYYVNIVLEKTPESELISLSGIAMDEDGEPVEGASAFLCVLDANGIHSGLSRVKTDKEGIFTFENVAPQPYHIALAKEGYPYEAYFPPIPVDKLADKHTFTMHKNRAVEIEYVYQPNGSRDFTAGNLEPKIVTLESNLGNGFRFADGAMTNQARDIDYRSTNGKPQFHQVYFTKAGNGFYDAGKVAFDSVREAEEEDCVYINVGESGYPKPRPVEANHVYVVKTTDGKYAKFIVRKITVK